MHMEMIQMTYIKINMISHRSRTQINSFMYLVVSQKISNNIQSIDMI